MDIKAELMKLNVRDENTLDEYIEFCIINSNKDDYDCVHHIIHKAKSLFPQYKNLKNNSWNASYLSYKNHFIAHWLLLKAIKEKSISFAFFSMKNKDLVNGRIDKDTIEMYASEYEEFYKDHKEMLKDLSRDIVSCLDLDGNKVRVSSKEYQDNKNKYVSFSNNMVNVFDSEQNKTVRIYTKDYNKDIHFVWSKGKSRFYNKQLKTFEFMDAKDKKDYHIHSNKGVFILRDNKVIGIKIREIIDCDVLLDDSDVSKFYNPIDFDIYIDLIDRGIYRVDEFSIFYNIYTKKIGIYKGKKPHLLKTKYNKIKCFDRTTGRSVKIQGLDFDKKLYLIKYKGIYFKDIDSRLYYTKDVLYESQSYVFIKNERKKRSPNRTPTIKGQVSCKDIDGKFYKVSKQEFDSRDDLFGVNKGYINCISLETNKYVKITSKHYKENKHLYKVKTGVKNKGTITVYIYDKDRNLIHITDDAFNRYCDKHRLPQKALYKSMKDGVGIYTKVNGKHYINKHPELHKFIGWTASYTKYEDVL